LKAIAAPEQGQATLLLNDAGIAALAPAAADAVNRGQRVLAADLAFTGDWWRQSGAWAFQQIVHATGQRAIGIEAAQLVELARWLAGICGAKQVSVETFGVRTQTTALIAAALEPGLFSSITVRDGQRSLSYLLDKPVEYAAAPDLFCLDLFRYFDLDRLAAIASPTQVKY
jgi:hypothetical protein